MREPRRLRRPLIAGLAGLALASVVVSSAAGLGGLRTEDLGAAAASVHTLDGATLDWAPEWHDGGWRVGALGLTADPSRGFLAGDSVDVTIAGASTCEIATETSAATATIELDGADLTAACGALPRLTAATSVALSVTGADGETLVSNLGALTGSVAGFAGAVAQTAALTITTTGSTVTSVVVDVPNPAALQGGRAVVVLTASGSTDTLVTTVSGAQATIDVSGEGWTTATDLTFDVAISVPQSIGSADGAASVLLSHATRAATPIPGDGGGGTNPDDGGGTGDGGGTPTPGTGGNGLVPVTVSPGISYSYSTPWRGAQTNALTFCHSFTVTNTTRRPLGDWTVQLNTRLAPMWGMDPTAPGTVQLSNIETRSYDRTTGYWTVGGSNGWASQLQPGGARTVQFCALKVPTPQPNPSLYKVEVSVAPSSDYYVAFRVRVTSTSEFYVPWRAEIDFATLVCGTSLTGHPLTFQSVNATPVAGSGSRYTITGTSLDTQLVSASHSREFIFASYSPGPGWRLPCGQG